MRYIWDERKNAANIRKHGIAFERAMRIFESAVLLRIDERFDYGETRIQAIGLVDGVEVYVVYTEPEEGLCRIISARKATPKERKAFWQKVARAQR